LLKFPLWRWFVSSKRIEPNFICNDCWQKNKKTKTQVRWQIMILLCMQITHQLRTESNQNNTHSLSCVCFVIFLTIKQNKTTKKIFQGQKYLLLFYSSSFFPFVTSLIFWRFRQTQKNRVKNFFNPQIINFFCCHRTI
jgi:dipeptide/tripeptide permease